MVVSPVLGTFHTECFFFCVAFPLCFYVNLRLPFLSTNVNVVTLTQSSVIKSILLNVLPSSG